MPFEDFFNLDDKDLTDKDLERLFNQIEKKQKELEKTQKKLERQGGALANTERKTKALPQATALDEVGVNALGETQSQAAIFGGETANLPKGKTQKDIAQKRDRLKSLLNSDLGAGKASQALSILQNPTDFIIGKVPILIGVMIAAGLVQQIWAELSKRGGLLSTFFEDEITTRLDAFRERLTTAEILGGFTQIINESPFSRTPRDTYNSFELFTSNKEQLENDFSIRNKFGV